MKLFGIGLSRTGTKSLAEALSILGFKTGHYDEGMAAIEQTPNGLDINLKAVAEWDALTDIPAAAFYQELDQAFPGSKFICTVRDKESWLVSIERHFMTNIQRYREGHGICADKASALREKMYGTTRFDTEVMSKIFDVHYGDVGAYFSGREHDLLMLDICGSATWEPLCSFLEKSVPEVSFPAMNVRSANFKPSEMEDLS